MELTKTHIKFIQQELNKMGYDAGIVDGDAGKNTKAALLKVPGNMGDWPFKKQAVAFIQLVCKNNNFNPGKIDGLWGSDTEFAYDEYVYFLENGEKRKPWRDDETPIPNGPSGNPNNWPKEKTAEFDAFYGQPGEDNLVRMQFPYPMRISWNLDTMAKSTRVHKKVKDSLQRVLTNVLNHYGLDEIKRLRLDVYAGCFKERPIRGGTRPSTHSWGIALDFDDQNNKLNWNSDKATFASPEYDKWWEFWEEEGWLSLGRARNYDWMHVQAAR